MNYDDEDTRVFELIDQKEEEQEDIADKNKKNKTNKKCSLKERWNKFTKKQKVLIIFLIVLLMIFIIIGIIFFVSKNTTKPEIKLPEDPKIVIENKNYRYEDGNLILLDKNEQEIGKYVCKNKDNEKCYVAYNSNEDDLDETKYVYEDGKSVNTQTPIINDTYVFIYDNDNEKDSLISLYNIKEEEIEEVYLLVKKAINDETYFIVANTEGNYGLIQLTEEGIVQVIKFNYEYLAVAEKSVQQLGNLIAKSNDKYYLINKDENQITKPIKEAIVGFNDNFIKVKTNDGAYTVYGYNGSKILENTYDYVYLVDKYLGVIKDKLLYIIDEKENYLNIEGIKLSNTYYNKTYIYDQNDKMLEIKNAADIKVEENNIMVTLTENDNEKTYTINVLEAIVNNTLNYVSYIDGKLYFYSDEQKKNLIGSYPCKNKNTIIDETSILQNCYLAKESSYAENTSEVELGYLPIINNRYVFVNDVLDTSKQSIVLYDLVEKETKSTYLSVDAGIYSGVLSLTFYDTDNLNIIALSAKKNKYGMITITKDNVTAFLEFSNNKIERLGDYYLVNRSSGTYALLDNTKNFITKDYSYKIVNYYKNYVKVIDNNKYRLFGFDGKEITNESYDYIELFADNYVAIKDNKLLVSTYDNVILIKDVELKITDYDNAYSIDNDGVTIYNADKTFEKFLYIKEEANGEE
ncbi:MAG: hypothetical protein IJA94_05655 [Bacilli bacterium]|nr:hypothetical protein [Bacilli bacterium]